MKKITVNYTPHRFVFQQLIVWVIYFAINTPMLHAQLLDSSDHGSLFTDTSLTLKQFTDHWDSIYAGIPDTAENDGLRNYHRFVNFWSTRTDANGKIYNSLAQTAKFVSKPPCNEFLIYNIVIEIG